jgi:hypothetical protein
LSIKFGIGLARHGRLSEAQAAVAAHMAGHGYLSRCDRVTEGLGRALQSIVHVQ